MRMVDLIEKKRDGGVLTDDEIRFIIRGFTDGSIPDYQMSAFAMTVFYKGMTDHETAVLTDAMMHSGDTVDLSRFGDKSVDKHSTGGVGDKTTLIVAPIVSSLGGKMAKMSGRGLGHTGGTVDKLESIPGYQTTLSADAFMRQVEQVGVAVIGQSGNLTPADKKLYALRDVTATIDSLPLITSSIMSKKLAAGAHSIVLDVKIGSGAFMKTLEDGQKLAESMVRIGRACGRNVVAVMSNMDIPLGFYIGNALEVREAVEVLQGHGCPDLTGVCITLAANMLHLCNGWPIEEATKQAQEAISSGRAFEQMKRWIAAQGGDAAVLDNVSLLPQASVQYELKAPQAGYIHHMDAQKIGESSAILGAGRKTKDDVIDPAAGIVLKEKTGAKVEQGQTLAVLHTDRPETLADAERVFLEAIRWGADAPAAQPLIYGIVTE
ncbi:MAG: pyrimidine-nucleoside phosphorylase [Oscillospiraceae bacterium]|jgi:pyrimidine-nucleoside phosphorylase|nr:pyrimidine-nucleoside phosphorylase [Clostridiales bacterium]MCI7133475.1 pyrimidine-nucleoside phosphorylase [Clostridiales bacterium]MDD7249451.1 pyrimidine-nucleoside phosphorylase [Clostridiales bacterium]MDY2717726.1 pyrimidine-nucleoside phosphorylase [Oscillospiraceae bacterium]